MIPKGEADRLKTQVNYRHVGSEVIRKGEALGEMTASLNNKVLASTPLVATEAAKPAGTIGSLWNRVKQSL
jgi:D-alanyl-D-alanine carboxypeptidase (penicillin-binding protein 5/6)